MAEMGAENKYLVEIISGIKEGEIIVTSGAYLINIEFFLKEEQDKDMSINYNLRTFFISICE